MESATHHETACALAQDFAAGDDTTRRQIAVICEEQGILAALVVLALPQALRPDFVAKMQEVLSDSR